MNHLLEDDPDLMPRREREVTLSTGAILGIFFGLVLLCGFFFALGYNLRKPAPQPVATTAADVPDSTSSARFDHFNKPSAGSPVNTPQPAPAPAAAANPSGMPAPAAEPPPAEAAASTPHPAPVTPHPAAPAAPQPDPAALQPPGSFVVQVAALSREGDAELLVGALHSRGYTVTITTTPQDKLFHVQVGPFSSHKDADAMRQRLVADGYNAMIK